MSVRYHRPMRELADASGVTRLTRRLAAGLRARMAEAGGEWALVGLKSRGDVLAHRLAAELDAEGGDGAGPIQGRVGSLDITLYRDDLSEVASQPIVRTTEIDFAIDALHVVVVDDVLMTGRTARAALQSLMDIGRPRRVWLAVLVDRGGRELPIRADEVALDLSRDDLLGHDERVRVMLRPTDERDAVVVAGGD